MRRPYFMRAKQMTDISGRLKSHLMCPKIALKRSSSGHCTRIGLLRMLFIIMFLVYTVSPLKSSRISTENGFSNPSVYAFSTILLVEKVLSVIIDTSISGEIVGEAEYDDEFLLKKKRALFRAWVLILLALMTILWHIARKFGIIIDEISPPLTSLVCGRDTFYPPTEVFLAPHSGLAPPVIS